MATSSSTLGIGGVWTSFEFFWTDQMAHNKVAMRATTTIDGGTSIQVSDTSSTAYLMTMQGHAYYSEVNSLKALADVVGATYVCTFNDVPRTVMFNSSQGSAISMQQAYPISNPASDDVFVGTIALLVI